MMMGGGIPQSLDGKYQVLAVNSDYLYMSSDYGVTWNQLTTDATRTWQCVGISSTGQYITAGAFGGYLYVSSDYGVTFNAKTIYSFWRSVKISASGQYQIACGQGYIYRSTNYGVTWNSVASPSTTYWLDISGTGQYQIASCINVEKFSVYVSSNYGVTWTLKTTLNDMSAYGVAVSQTGQYMIALDDTKQYRQIWRSSDYGETWSNVGSGAFQGSYAYIGIAISGTGQYMYAGAMFSTNYGASWNYLSYGAYIDSAMNMSDSGKYMAGGGPYGIFVYSTYGVGEPARPSTTNRNYISCAINKSTN